jgi:hypothetical protein
VQVKKTINLIIFLLKVSEKSVVNNKQDLSEIKHEELALMVRVIFFK